MATERPMHTTTDEIADGIFRISTWVPEVTPDGFTFNQFLVRDDESLLFHAGMRGLFPSVAEAVGRLIDPASLRWLSFGHVEADESGATNAWLAAAPGCQVAFGALGCDISLNDMCDRPPRPLAEGEVIDLGDKRLRQISTPHVPHGWEAQVLYEEATGTLLCGDLLSQVGRTEAITTDDIVDPALGAEAVFHAMALGPDTSTVLHRLADLRPTTLAVMHGASFAGDGDTVLRRFAAGCDELATAATPAGGGPRRD
jgi:flavorubredoxin